MASDETPPISLGNVQEAIRALEDVLPTVDAGLRQPIKATLMVLDIMFDLVLAGNRELSITFNHDGSGLTKQVILKPTDRTD